MFTGIIREIGTFSGLQRTGTAAIIEVACPQLALICQLGDSIAVNGVCLTVAKLAADRFWADLSTETLALTTLGRLARGAKLNLEPALALSDRLGGHLVLGHIDGIGQLRQSRQAQDHALITIAIPETLRRYVAYKSSLAVDGVSLTVAELTEDACQVAIIPATMRQTNLGCLGTGDQVNLETDILARYVERLITTGANTPNGLNMNKLEQWGYG